MKAETGTAALRIAREAMELWVRKRERLEPRGYPPALDGKGGCFVTIRAYPEGGLRGCIGYPEPAFPLVRALVDSAIHATQDPRFPPLAVKELDKVTVEVSILTRPSPMKNYPQCIEIGRDGLVVERGDRKGILLPQVAMEHGLGREEFLAHACLKAGLPPDAWKDRDTRIQGFQSEVFSEGRPMCLGRDRSAP